jgi:hypothetical protein
MGDAIPGNAGGRINDGQSPPGEPIEYARLADVRPAYDNNLWNTH